MVHRNILLILLIAHLVISYLFKFLILLPYLNYILDRVQIVQIVTFIQINNIITIKIIVHNKCYNYHKLTHFPVLTM
ncbi:hypothetical protein GLOIN_2v1627550 [Rhizophagus irregularis DAOM 181602=DAOM 197198]|uniref:Uncharacterized protein n=1 Tax=Rhizophagus irregularis (strain DAOM 181602 / DAOM 197198 / MUCL 43194) TaxID=747089 RepID=A0A2P4PVM4_RHIID|nr:hypothetical protein GLOIN_2v1627550 [Rhizophagus irregularis DAOM 181602=DAOM 197198]POG69418.1 hypothetical protein GLOIN_2v1627550 [Rhizophagus irregularis DAOM 181602=DAOM 197198]|eukprot:XP_025176284.1 hypothetical protein GLOIN_2v1627550 [Rhizophagus irregularis DAOM 181602=DAOM 197198]